MNFQRILTFLAGFLLFSGAVFALEPLPDQGDPMAQELPSLSAMDPIAPSGQTDNTLPELPQDVPGAAPVQNDLPPLPGDTAGTPNGQALPPLPGETAPAAAPANEESRSPLTGGTAPAPSAVQPAEPVQPAASEPMPPLPGQTPTPETRAAVQKPAKVQKEARPWEATKKRANAILGGWVRAKGGNESSRIAWASQGALNALVYHGYKVLEEKGLYDGQPDAQGRQWRLITFEVPKVKRTLEVYVTDVKGRVWMRVGPSEPPPFSVHSIGQVKAIRTDSVKALGHIRKELKGRLRPHRGKSWEAPYSFAMASADHK